MSAARRVPAVDIARSAALAGMVVYHAGYDLQLFGLLPAGTMTTGVWALFARFVAGSFLFLAGVSLWLAHGEGLRWRAFWRRWVVIAAAAGLVTAATRVAMPETFVFFGILHAIAVSSLIGLLVLRLPAAAVLALAAVIFVLPWVWSHEVFARPWLLWTGLAPKPPVTMDYEPVFPWAAPFLAGLALARIAGAAGIWARLAGVPGRMGRILAWPGRHSLAIYLLHQPVLIGALWAGLRIWPG